MSESEHTLHLHRLGRGSTKILALHGFTGSGRDFGALAEFLPECQLVAPDLLGHGLSKAPVDRNAYTMDATVERLLRVRAKHGLETPSVILGYSMGGRCALHLATHLRGHLDALILVGTNPGLCESEARSVRQEQDEKLAAMIEDQGVAHFADYWETHPMIQSQRRIAAPLREQMRRQRRDACAAGLCGSLRGRGTGTHLQ